MTPIEFLYNLTPKIYINWVSALWIQGDKNKVEINKY